MNILIVGAHPDDIELMAGGAIVSWLKQGHSVHAMTFTDGVWVNPEGVKMRNSEDAIAEGKAAASVLGYEVENLGHQAMDLAHSDQHVVEVLERIAKYNIDTLVCPWSNDVHHDHEVASRIAVSASRKVPRLLMGQINYYLRETFNPNYFVDITADWDKKIEALSKYESEWSRNEADWTEYLDITSRYYGKMCGVKRAEGFRVVKFLESA